MCCFAPLHLPSTVLHFYVLSHLNITCFTDSPFGLSLPASIYWYRCAKHKGVLFHRIRDFNEYTR